MRTGDVAVVETSKRAEEEAQGDEQEDQRALLFVPHVVRVDERECDSEEIEESGAGGRHYGTDHSDWFCEEQDDGLDDRGARGCWGSAEDHVCTVRLDNSDFALEELGGAGFALP